MKPLTLRWFGTAARWQSARVGPLHPDHQDSLDPRNPLLQVDQPFFNAIIRGFQARDPLETEPAMVRFITAMKTPSDTNGIQSFSSHFLQPVSRPSNPWGFIGLSCVKVSVPHRAEAWGLTTTRRFYRGYGAPQALQDGRFEKADRPLTRIHLGAAPDGESELFGDVPDHASSEGRDARTGRCGLRAPAQG